MTRLQQRLRSLSGTPMLQRSGRAKVVKRCAPHGLVRVSEFGGLSSGFWGLGFLGLPGFRASGSRRPKFRVESLHWEMALLESRGSSSRHYVAGSFFPPRGGFRV